MTIWGKRWRVKCPVVVVDYWQASNRFTRRPIHHTYVVDEWTFDKDFWLKASAERYRREQFNAAYRHPLTDCGPNFLAPEMVRI